MRDLEDIGEQNGIVLDHLTRIGPLTSLRAAELYGITRLASRICDLEKLYGVRVPRRRIRVPRRNGKYTYVAEYYIDNEEDNHE